MSKVTIRELLDTLDDLHEWQAQQGGYEGKAWENLKLLRKRVRRHGVATSLDFMTNPHPFEGGKT